MWRLNALNIMLIVLVVMSANIGKGDDFFNYDSPFFFDDDYNFPDFTPATFPEPSFSAINDTFISPSFSAFDNNPLTPVNNYWNNQFHLSNTFDSYHLYVDNFLDQQVASVPDPMFTWLEKKFTDDLKTAASIHLSALGFIGWPSTLGAVGLGAEVGKALSPYDSPLRDTFSAIGDASSILGLALPGDIDSKIFDTGSFVLGHTLLNSDFNPHSPVIESASIPINHSWSDGSLSIKGTMHVTKTFIPDYDLWRTDIFPWGTHTKNITANYTIHENINGNNFLMTMKPNTFLTNNIYTPPPINMSQPSLSSFNNFKIDIPLGNSRLK